MKAQFSMVCVVIGLALFVRATDSSSGKLTGAVRDSEGAVIANATVLVHWDNQGADAPQGASAGLKEDLRLTTDKMGVFSSELAPGFYDVAVFAHAFSPNARKIRIRGGQTTIQDAKLPIDSQVVAEFGDDFPTEIAPIPLISSPEPK